MRRGHRISIIAILLCLTAAFAFWQLRAKRQSTIATFIQHQLDGTQRNFIDTPNPSVRGLAFRLDFLTGYFEHYIQSVHDPELRGRLEHDYARTRTNALVVLRRLTNDLGDDLSVWIETYGK